MQFRPPALRTARVPSPVAPDIPPRRFFRGTKYLMQQRSHPSPVAPDIPPRGFSAEQVLNAVTFPSFTRSALSNLATHTVIPVLRGIPASLTSPSHSSLPGHSAFTYICKHFRRWIWSIAPICRTSVIPALPSPTSMTNSQLPGLISHSVHPEPHCPGFLAAESATDACCSSLRKHF